MHPAHLALLKKGHWFGGLPLSLQEQILQRSAVRSYGKGEFVIREGDAGRGMFALLHGRTRHVRWVGEAEEVLLHVGEPGVWFGEYPLLSGQPSVGSVIAEVESRVLFLPAAEFERIVAADPRYLRPFAALLAERFAFVYRYLAQAHGLSPEEFLHARLKGVVAMQRLDQPSSGPADVSLSQAALANMVGVSRQTLSGLLARLEARGLVEVGYRKIRVLG
jgi:CRP-like cAMP-binding protein